MISFHPLACLLSLLFFSLSLVAEVQDAKICLTMIVKNESAIMARCLDSIREIVDCISICDTGSTDNTIEIIEKFIQENQIPGRVHRHDWKNFGHNRTLSFKAAQETIKELGFPLASTYLLLLDADMILCKGPNFTKNLSNDSYIVMQKSNELSYYNTRLIRASLDWKCKGVTHEYWSCDNSKQIEIPINNLIIRDLGDGGSKSDKFERDIRLLTQGLQEEPDNDRYIFYLAQSHKCLNHYPEAIQYYKKRIDTGGWREEVWYSKFMVGECYEEMGYWEHALYWYLDAFGYDPLRAEPLQKIATHYRSEGKNDLAYFFAKQGASIPYPKDRLLFVSHPVYDYQFDEEISIAAFYTPHRADGFDAVNRLMLRKEVPAQVKETARQNVLFYVGNLKNIIYTPLQIQAPALENEANQFYFPMNPSIRKTDQGYKIICRTVNYHQKGGLEYRSRDKADSKIRTRNFLLECSKDFTILSQKEIIDRTERPRKESQIIGLEDCRLFAFNGEDWFLCSAYDTPLATIVQSLCTLKTDQGQAEAFVDRLIPYPSPHGKDFEKNWLPFPHEGSLLAIYSMDPFRMYEIDPAGGCHNVKNQETTHDFSHFRGSAGPIPFEDGYLLMVHEVVFKDQRYYLHRFVYLDKNFDIKRVSQPFTFLHKGIEYCCGMEIDHAKENCILTLGIEDRKAYIAQISLKTVEELLQPLP